MIVTVDGPAGAGKSSVARALAARLGFEVLDTGAMYRAVTLSAQRAGVGPENTAELAHLLSSIKLRLTNRHVFLDNEDVSQEIRSAEVTRGVGAIADSPLVRRQLVIWQQEAAADRNMICEGRDQGTIVFPDAACKFFLKADPLERARRRQREMAGRGESVALEEVLRAQDERDRRDAARDLAPMVPAPDARIVDSTHLTIDQMVALMERDVRRCLGQP